MNKKKYPYTSFICGGFLGLIFLSKINSVVMVLLVEHSNLTMKTLYGVNSIFKILILSQMIGLRLWDDFNRNKKKELTT
jgi:hypothetical protein